MPVNVWRIGRVVVGRGEGVEGDPNAHLSEQSRGQRGQSSSPEVPRLARFVSRCTALEGVLTSSKLGLNLPLLPPWRRWQFFLLDDPTA